MAAGAIAHFFIRLPAGSPPPPHPTVPGSVDPVGVLLT
jgi:hypothetical protein